MASTACFLHPHGLVSTPARSSSFSSQRILPTAARPSQVIVCRAQKQAAHEDEATGAVSRRLALTVLIGAAAIGSKVAPADAAYGEAGTLSHFKFC